MRVRPSFSRLHSTVLDFLALLAEPCHSSYTGFDRDLIGRGRVQLVAVPVPQGDAAFEPSSLKAFEAALKKCKKEGITVRAVVSLSPVVKNRTFDLDSDRVQSSEPSWSSIFPSYAIGVRQILRGERPPSRFG